MAEVALTFVMKKLSEQLLGQALARGDEVTQINDAIQAMKWFLNDADKKRERDQVIEEWVTDVKNIAYRAEDVIDEFIYQNQMLICPPHRQLLAIESLPSVIFLCLALLVCRDANHHCRAKLLRQLRGIKVHMGEVRNRMSTFSPELTPDDRSEERLGGGGAPIAISSVHNTVVGMESHEERLKKYLLDRERQETVVIFVVGMMGIGKTTLAARVYERIQSHFDCYAWVSVSRSHTIKDVLREMLIGFYLSMSKTAPEDWVDSMDEAALGKTILHCLQGKNYLFIMDDVWNEHGWEKVRQALPQEYCAGKVVITTRDAGLPTKMTHQGTPIVHNLEPLSLEDSWSLFCLSLLLRQGCRKGKSLPQELKTIGEEILGKFEGIPLAIVTIGGLLSTKGTIHSEWLKVQDKLYWHLNLSDRQGNVSSGLAGSSSVLSSGFEDLSPVLKCCFLYCSLFPQNCKISTKRLIRLWVAEDFVQEDLPGLTPEESAEYQLRQLIERNMLQVAKIGVNGELISCRVLWLMRTFALDVFDKDSFCTFTTNFQEISAKKNHRRLSFHGRSNDLIKAGKNGLERLRSLLFFGKDDQPQTFCIGNLPSKLKLLRVLELQDLRIATLSEAVGGLILLRYLGLRKTMIKKIPRSLQKLKNLETLDIRETNVKELPDLHSFQKLRHLYLSGSFVNKVIGISNGIVSLQVLQTLAGVKITTELAQELGHVTQLRKLSVGRVKREDSATLCASINKMTLLHSLTIKCDQGEILNMQTLVPSPRLNKLKLGCQADNLLNWVNGLSALNYLYLWDCILSKDPLLALRNLSNLIFLSLCNAYEGKQISCDAGGFLKLKNLSICRLKGLEEWGIKDGAMPVLQELFISHCPSLKKPPVGLDKIATLKVVRVIEMPVEFQEGVQKNIRENGYRVLHGTDTSLVPSLGNQV